MSSEDVETAMKGAYVTAQLVTGEEYPTGSGYLIMTQPTLSVWLEGAAPGFHATRFYWRGIPIYTRSGLEDGEVQWVQT